MSEDQRKDLPPASSPAFLERAREALSTYLGNRGDKLDRGVTLRDLVDGGVVKLRPGYLSYGGKSPVEGLAVDGLGSGGAVDLTPPPTPTGFTASPGISKFLVQHDVPGYTQGGGHGSTNLYGYINTTAATPTFNDAQLITRFEGPIFSYATEPATTWHLWIKWVSIDGVESTSPAGGINGLVVTTGQDVALLLGALSTKITTSQLATALNTRINLLDSGATGGLAGQYSVKMDSNGFVSGFGLQSSLIAGGTPTSTFIVSVDKFAVAAPASSITNWSAGASISINEVRGVAGNTDKVLVCKTAGTTSGSTPAIAGVIGTTLQDGGVTWQIASRVPFSVLTVPTTINGVSVPAGVYIDAAYVLNGTIKKSQLGNAIIDDAKIIDLSASKLLSGSLAVGADIASSGFSTGVSGWRIQGNGNAEFQSGLFRGTLYATAGSIGGNTIDSTGLQSPGYSAGSSGWRISSFGFAEFSSVTIRGASTFSGNLNVVGPGADRMEITNTRIKIFSGGVERVRIGDLTG